MREIAGSVQFETRTIGPLVLTTPFLRRLGLSESIDRLCPLAEQADLGHGTVAELVVQCRLTEPHALFDMPGWAEQHDIAALYPSLNRPEQLNDDRVGRMLDAIYEHRPLIWGELIGRAAQVYQLDLRRLHADSMPVKFAGAFADQANDPSVARLEPGYNPHGEWVQQLKLFALASGDGGLPVWFDTLNGAAGDSPAYVPQFEAFCQHAQLASHLPLEQVIIFGDRKMPTAENQLAWLRLGVGYIGPQSWLEPQRQALRELLVRSQGWKALPYVAQREQPKAQPERTHYQGVGQTVSLADPATGTVYPVRQLYVHSSAQAAHDAKRRQAEINTIERELKRLQGLVNKYDYHTPEIISRRVQQKAFKQRAAQRYFRIQVVSHAERPDAPLELRYALDQAQVASDAELDGVYLLVAGGPAAALDDTAILQEWKGQYKIEHCFRLTNQLCLFGPVCLKNPKRIVSLIFLIMVGCLVAGLIERQIRRVLAERQTPIRGLMPEGRDTLKPSVTRILKAFAHYSLVRIKRADGGLLKRQLAQLDSVQQQILNLLGLPSPTELFAPLTVT